MKTIIYIFLLLLILCIATHSISVAAPEHDLDLQTLIAGIKHFDTSVPSGKGEFVYEHKMGSYVEKRTYALTFDGTTYDEAQIRIKYHSNSAFDSCLAEIYDGERQWDINKAKRELFSVDISLDDYKQLNKATPKLPKPVIQKLKTHDINISDDFRIQNEGKNSYSKIIDNVTGHSHHIYYTEKYFLFYTSYKDYSVRPACVIHPPLDPRYWMTTGKSTSISYLMTPLWEVLETYESEILKTEMLNGQETYLVRVKHPKQKSLKLWISPEKGFRLVKMQNVFETVSAPGGSSPIKKGTHYLMERLLHYKEYLPGIWYPEKIERTIYPLLATDATKKGDPVGKTTLKTVKCELNIDVSGRFQLDVPEETMIYDYQIRKERPLREFKLPSK